MTVHGIERIREYLGEFKSNYVIIGGCATNINLENAALEGRTTKDIDMIVVCEALTHEYLNRFWEMIRAAGYEPSAINTETGIKRTFYRFDKPKDATFPKYIELFCRIPETIALPKDMHLVHISSEDEYLSSFSAIIMDDDYYRLAVTHAVEMQGVQVLDKYALVLLKAKAYLNNVARRIAGQRVHSDDIDKHKRDVYRLSFLYEEYDEITTIPDSIKNDLRQFLEAIKSDPINTQAISHYMGVGEVSQDELIIKFTKAFGL